MEGDPTVETMAYQCHHCGSHNGPTFHDGVTCEGPVLKIDGEWTCGRCGVIINSTATCSECGSETTPTSNTVSLAIEPEIPYSKIESTVHDLTNRQRHDHSAGELSYSSQLSAIALQHSRDMAQRDYFDHRSPEGNEASDRYREYGADRMRVGENIALRTIAPSSTPESIAESIISGWMDSQGHRETLLHSEFSSEGIGIYCRSDGTMYITQNFQ